MFLPWLQEEVPEKETELKVDIQEGPPPSSGWRLGSWWMVDNRSNIFFAPDEGIYIYTHMRVFVLGPYLAICGLENSVAKQKEMEHMMIAWINNMAP